jgi:hypothetical protein
MKLTDEHTVIWTKDIRDFAWIREFAMPRRSLIHAFGMVYKPDKTEFDPGGCICGVAIDHYNRVVRLFTLTREDRLYRRVPPGAVKISSIRINAPSKTIGGVN